MPKLLKPARLEPGQTIGVCCPASPPPDPAAIDRALKWDAATANGFTSKKKYATTYQEIRSGLKSMRDEVEATADSIRANRKKAGLEIRD